MLNSTLLTTLNKSSSYPPGSVLHKVFFFHDVRVTCQTNHPAIIAILDDLLGIFPKPSTIRGEGFYSIFCYSDASQFPVQMPHERIRIASVRLPTNTKLKYYLSPDYTTEYQSFTALPSVNEAALSIVSPHNSIVLTQLQMPEQYQTRFLQRYVLLIALGQLIRQYGFEPCHAATITAPLDNQQGALIIGASGSGKTTLSLGSTIAGCGLLGDDIILLRDDAHLINAYTAMREVSVRSYSLDLWQTLSFLRAFPSDDRDKRYCTIEQVRTGATRIQAPIRLLIFPSLSTEKESRLTPLSKARTLQMLVDECLSKKYMYPQTQEQFFSLLCLLSEQAKGYQLAIARGATTGPQIVQSLFTGCS
jgi:hypothetical protein